MQETQLSHRHRYSRQSSGHNMQWWQKPQTPKSVDTETRGVNDGALTNKSLIETSVSRDPGCATMSISHSRGVLP